MTRLRGFVRTVASSYALLATSIVYQLASVPLALHYLSKTEFALWALMTQVTGYLYLIDLGMTSSVARLLIDYKDRRDGGEYGSLLLTGWLVLLVQSGIIFSAGLMFGTTIASLLQIPAETRAEFLGLLRWFCAVQAGMFSTRVLAQLLFAHQRYDLVNQVQLGQQLLGIFVLWGALHLGWGVRSFLWMLCVNWGCGCIALVLKCGRLRLFPARGAWGRPTLPKFRELFRYGKDVFLVALGTQLIMASQTFIITRNLGLEQAAVWAVCTKAFVLINQVIWRICDFSMPALAEMIVRQELNRLRARFRDIVMLSTALAVVAATGYALCNGPFVAVWTAHRISWSLRNDLLLAGWMIMLCVIHCHSGLVLATKEIRFMRFIYFVEGAVYVALAAWLSRTGGFASLIGCSLVAGLAFSGAYGAYRTAGYFKVPVRTVAVAWLQPALKIGALLVPVAVATGWLSGSLSAMPRFIIGVVVVGGLGGWLFLRMGIPHDLQRELLARAPARFQPVLQHVFAVS